ncbi:MAG: hypothetical protein WC974_09380 [Thermoplasmata archaeon]
MVATEPAHSTWGTEENVATNRYWVGGGSSTNWDATGPTNWSTTSGGANNASVPGVSDDVFFTSATSAPSTLSANITINSLDMTGYTGTLTHNGATVLTIAGGTVVFKLSAGMTYSAVSSSAIMAFAGTSGTTTITSAGKTIQGVRFVGSGGTFQLQDTLTIGIGSLTKTAGTFDANGQTVVFASAGIGEINGTFTGTSAFANLTRTGTAVKTDALTLVGNIEVTGTLTINGNSSINRVLVTSNTLGSARTITAATVAVTNADFRDITGAGAGSWNLSAITGLSGDALGNSGITFTTADIMYWTGDTGSWSDATQWCTTSGGCADNAGNGRVPLAQDDVIFDNGSFSTTGRTVTLDMPRAGKNIDWTGVTNTPALVITAASSIFGSLTLDAGMTLPATTQSIDFQGRGAYTLTSAGLQFSNYDISLNAPGGTLTLQDALNIGISKGLHINYGSFNANNYNVTTGTFTSSNSNVRTITMGSGTWTIISNGISYQWFLNTVTNLTFNAGASTIVLSDSSSLDKYFFGGGLTYNNITFSGDKFTVVGSNTFNTFALNALNTNGVLLTTGTTQTVANFTSNGDGSNKPKLRSTTTTNATITKSGGGTICEDYIDVDYITGTPANTWYVGANSTDGGHNSGLIFTACFPTVTTASATSVTATGATLNGEITSTGGADVTVRGFLWGTNAELSGGDTATTTESGTFGTGTFTNSSLTLTCNTTYYSRAYATNSTGTSYGAISDSFTTGACAPGRYWVGGGSSANWDATGPTNWSDTSGGANNASVPGVSDDVFFTSATSAPSTLSANITVNSLDMTGYTGTLTHNAAVTLTHDSSGVFKLASGMTYTLGDAATSAITFTSTSGTTAITTAGKTLGNMTFNGVGGTWQLQDALNVGNVSAAATLTLTNGTFDSNNQTITAWMFSSSNTNTRTLTLGSSTINLKRAQSVCFDTNEANLTVTANTATIVIDQTYSTFRTSGAKDWNGLSLVLTGSASVLSVNGSTFANITKTGVASKTDTLDIHNITITGTLTINGNSSTNRVIVESTALGTPRTITAANVVVTNADFRDITGAGAGNWDLSAITGLSGDALGNSGITFTSATTTYWVGGTGLWSDVNEWANTSGGTGGTGRVPLPQDDVVLDANSGFGASQDLDVDMPRIGRNIDWTGVPNNPRWDMQAQGAMVFGNLTLATTMRYAGTASLSFAGRGSHTITSNGISINSPLAFVSFGGTYTLQDAITTLALFVLTNGTFDANDYNVTTTSFSNGGTATRTLTMGSGTFTITGTGSVWNTVATGFTLNAETSTIALTNTTTSVKTFIGAGLTYNNVEITGSNVLFTGSNTFNNLALNNAGQAIGIRFTGGTTQTLNTFETNGSAGNLVYASSTNSSAATLAKSGGGTICEDYMHLTWMAGTPADTWYVGANSTDGTNNSGMIFTGCPAAPSASSTPVNENVKGGTKVRGGVKFR